MKRRAALLVVDVQRDFCPGGALPVPGGDLVVPVLNRYLQLFAKRGSPIFVSRDWHPVDSQHFKEHGGKWPMHCVQETQGAEFHPELMLPEGTILISKGMARWDDAYSAFDGVTQNGTPLALLLHRMALDRLYIGGLTIEYCVRQSTLDALREGFRVTVLADAVRGLEFAEGDSARVISELVEAGAELATLESIGAVLAGEGA